MRQQGFSLIEIVVAIMISTIVATALFTTLFQTQKSEDNVAKMVSGGMRLATTFDRIQKDFSGIFWPRLVTKTSDTNKDLISGAERGIQKQLDDQGKKTDEPASKPTLLRILFSSNQEDGLLKEFGFITSDPLQVYSEAKPRVARVIYYLAAVEGKANSFALMRQESEILNYQQAREEAQAYELVAGVKSLGVSYFYQQEDNDEFKELKELDFGEDQNEDKSSYQSLVPSYIKMDLELWLDDKQEDILTETFWFQIPNIVKSKDSTAGEAKEAQNAK